MFRTMKPFAFLLALCCLATAASLPAAAQGDAFLKKMMETKTVRVGAIEAFPYYKKDLATGKWEGIMPDLCDLMFGSIGVKVEYVTTDWGTAAAGLQSNKFDLVGGLNATPKRALALAFSTAIAPSNVSVLTYATDTEKFRTWARLNDPSVKIAAVDGASTTVVGQKFLPKATWTLVKSNDAMVLQLESHRVDVILSNEPTLTLLKKTRGKGTLILPEPVRAQPINFGLRKDDPDLKDWLDVALNYYKESGDVQGIWNKYLPK
jgi:polar amino acid transport system substrate-binding protein